MEDPKIMANIGNPKLKPLTYKKEIAKVGHDCFDFLTDLYINEYRALDEEFEKLNKEQIVEMVDEISKNCSRTEEYWKIRQRFHSTS